tara:strand:+ start:153 stop:803 length:651 start_codon:yes stop_codon:yes gene_type:complete
MGSLKLPHASGNSMSIAAPATNPASNLTLTLPATVGTAGQVLQTDGSGNLSWVDLPTSGISEYDMYVLTGDLTGSQAPITGTWARPTTAALAQYIGSGMSQSSGVFTFPNTGKWLVKFKCNIKGNNLVEVYGRTIIELTVDGGTNWVVGSRGNGNMHNSGGLWNYEMGHAECMIDVTSTSDVKVRFATTFSNSSTKIAAWDANAESSCSFMKLGAT